MGNLIRCCCSEDDAASTTGGSGDGYRSNETTPLLREAGGHSGRQRGGDRRISDGSGVDASSRRTSCQDSLPRVGFEGRVTSLHVDQVAANEELQKLNEILLESANEIIDCSAVATGRNYSTNAQGMATSTGSSAAHHSGGGQLDPAEMQARAATYARRVSAAAKTLAAKHLKPAPIYQGLVDVGGQVDKMHGQLANEVLTEADHVLAAELSSRTRETIAESDDLEVDNEEVIVAFGRKQTAA